MDRAFYSSYWLAIELSFPSKLARLAPLAGALLYKKDSIESSNHSQIYTYIYLYFSFVLGLAHHMRKIL